MLSFQIIQSGSAIQIYYDAAGMTTLVEALRRGLSPAGHVHLRAPSSGGRALNETNPWGDPAVTEVIITSADDGDDP